VKALVYHGPGNIALEDCPRPVVTSPSDALVRLVATSLCGTDLHIVRGDLPTIPPGRILGHEGVGIVEAVGSEVREVRPGERVLISLNTSCGRCDFCRRRMPSHCRHGGWALGNTLDGTQAEVVRVPFADNGLYRLPPTLDDASAVLLSCCFPTALECGVVAGAVHPGDRVAIVGAGPVGLATLLACQLYSPAQILVLDIDDHRLEAARALGATAVIDSSGDTAVAKVLELTRGEGVDVAIEAVGLSEAFNLCQAILAPGGRLANLGVHGAPVTLHLENLWASNITVTTKLVDGFTTPDLLQMASAGRLAPLRLVSHRFAFADILEAYKTFDNAASNQAIKVIVDHFASPEGALP